MAAGEPRVNSLLGRLTPYYSKALGHALHMAPLQNHTSTSY